MQCALGTAGYNHIAQEPGILITNTPGVYASNRCRFYISSDISQSYATLWDYIISYGQEEWKSGQKWDLDENFSRTIDNLTLGIVGMGEIGKELTKKVIFLGCKSILL